MNKIQREVVSMLSSEGVYLFDMEAAIRSIRECCAAKRCEQEYLSLISSMKVKAHIVPMNVFGVKMYAVELGDRVLHYCQDIGSAMDRVEKLNA